MGEGVGDDTRKPCLGDDDDAGLPAGAGGRHRSGCVVTSGTGS